MRPNQLREVAESVPLAGVGGDSAASTAPEKPAVAIYRTWIYLLCIAPLLFATGGGSKESSSPRPEATRELRAKLDEVIPEMLRLSNNDQEKSCLRAAQPFVNIRGLDMQVAGFSIPLGTNGKQAHVSFTVEHLRKTTREALAKEALEDFRMANQASGGK